MNLLRGGAVLNSKRNIDFKHLKKIVKIGL